MKKNCVLIIESDYYKIISENLVFGAKKQLKLKNVQFEIITVPGALEIPIILEKHKDNYVGFIILGCIIRGETSHFDLVKDVTSRSIYETSNKNSLPIGFGLLTVENENQAIERSHYKKKDLGGVAAKVCLKMMDLLNNE